MGLGCFRDVGAAARETGMNRPSPRWIRSWCSSMLVSVKRVSSLLPEAKQTIPEEGGGCHCTTCDITLHILLHITERCPTSLRNSWVLRSMVNSVQVEPAWIG